MDPSRLTQTEVILLAPHQQALALAYSAGETPSVVAAARGGDLATLLWSAQELGVPIVECQELDDESLATLTPGAEIPKRLFRPAAQAIALVQRSHPGPVPVRVVKDLHSNGNSHSRSWKQRVASVREQLDSARIKIQLANSDWLAATQALAALHKERLQVEIGLPILGLEVEVSSDLKGCDGQIIIQGLVEYQWHGGAVEDFGDLMLGFHESVLRNAHRLLGFRETEALVAGLKKSQPTLYKALFPEHLTLSALRRVLRNLLREGIKIRNLTSVLEAIEEHKGRTQDPDYLTEYVRSSLDFQLCREYADAQGTLHAMLVQPEVEEHIMKEVHHASAALWFDMDVDVSLRLLTGVARGLEKAQDQGVPAVLFCSPRPRRFLRRLVEPSFPHLPVLSYAEIAPETDVRVFFQIGL